MDVWNQQENLKWDVWNWQKRKKKKEIECMKWEFKSNT
jgi:hypothetical protein